MFRYNADGGRLLFPRWLRAGAAAAVWQTALTVFVLASAEPRLLAAGTILLSVAVAALSSVIAAYRLSRIDPGTALREGN